MNEINKGSEPTQRLSDDSLPDSQRMDPVSEKEPGLRDRVRKFIASAEEKKTPTKQQLSKDRTRSLTLLIGVIVGATLLLIGIFSNPPMPVARENPGHVGPSLGRPRSSEPEVTGALRSVTPLLTAEVQSDDSSAMEVSPADIQHKSQSSVRSDEVNVPLSAFKAEGQRAVAGSPRTYPSSVPISTPNPDPLAGFRVDENGGSPTYSYGGPPAGRQVSLNFSNRADKSLPPDAEHEALVERKSSIVFVRAAEPSAAPMPLRPQVVDTTETALLQPGTRLIARLDATVTSALKIPVVASIEYNYERDGKIVVPAGTKVIGELQQASSEGYISIRFHTLQMPGKDENLEAVAVDFNQQPLRGSVSGKNTGKRILSRTLSGVGTMAAYVIGAGGAGLNRSITGETLLRDRVASNVALAGEQELVNAAHTQNIAVTVPANTRFYVILEKATVQAPNSVPAHAVGVRSESIEMPTAQELRELMDLKREINQMYQESKPVSSSQRIRP